jgi:ankyrin repeat protein
MKKSIISVIFIFFLCVNYSCSDDTVKKINEFWKYISENEENIFVLNDQNSELYYEIYNKIQLINENIYIMFSNEIINNKKNLIVTSNGNKLFFGLCDKIVNLAPNYKYLKPISLFPALEKIEPFIFGEIVLRIEDVNVHFDNNNENIDLLFILNNKHLTLLQNDETGQLYNVYMQMLFMMTQQILGERIVGEKIKSGNISLVNLLIPSVPMSELEKYIIGNKSSAEINLQEYDDDYFINLLDKDVDNLKNDNDNIFHLIKNNDIHAIRELINKGFDVNMISSDKRFTPLIYSIQKGRDEIILLLLENNVNLELCSTFGSPLVVAAKKNNFELVKLLLSKGANINNNYRFIDNSGTADSAIFNAAIHFNYEMYDYLLEKNADVNIGNLLEGENALMVVITNFPKDDNRNIIYRNDIIRMVKKLIQDGIDINHSVYYGNVLTNVADRGDLEIMELLLENGADLNNYIKEKNMNTYNYICTFGSVEIIELMNKYYKQ